MSIKKIAELAGVSISTVSRVLNDPGYRCAVPGAREKIWKAAMELNYSPNEAARNLKLGRRVTDKIYYLNVLLTHIDEQQTDPFFMELLKVVESEIHKNNCILSRIIYKSVFSDEQRCARENLKYLVAEDFGEDKSRGDGLIVLGKCDGEILKLLSSKYKAVVSINRNSVGGIVDEVTCDGRKIAVKGIEYLLSLGHKKIAYMGECANDARYEGVKEALLARGIPLISGYVMDIHSTETEGYEAMERIFKMEDYPTAIYCANDIIAVGVLKCLARHKNLIYRPSVLGSDDIEIAQSTEPMLSTIKVPMAEMGKYGLDLLVDRLRGGHESHTKIEIDSKLVVRSSCDRVENSLWGDYCI